MKMRNTPSVFYIAILVFGICLTAHAAPIVVPPGLNPGDTYQLAFVSSYTVSAVGDYPSYYDAIVQANADDSGWYTGMGLTWEAIASFGGQTQPLNEAGENDDGPIAAHPCPQPSAVQANVHAMVYGQVYNTAGGLLAEDYDDFWGVGATRNLMLFPDGSPLSDFAHVWTGSTEQGAPGVTHGIGSLPWPFNYHLHISTAIGAQEDLQAGTQDDYATYGIALPYWDPPVHGVYDHLFDGGDAPKTEYKHLYALSSVITVPAHPIPLPPAILLLATGLAGLTGSRKRFGR